MKSFSIYIVDDHNLFLESIEAFISLQNQYHCVGHATDCDTAMKEIGDLKPDIVFIDYHLNETNGFELLKKIKEDNLDCITVILTMRRDAQIRNRAKEMGAQGYLLKSMGAEDLINALNEIVSLQTGFYDSIEEDLKAKGAQYRNLLTGREMQIAKMVTQGISSENIAEQLELSLHTVNSHRKNILRKLQAKNPIDLMNYLREIGEI
jgi:DNA-binding NarL/FixJ family response regulator